MECGGHVMRAMLSTSPTRYNAGNRAAAKELSLNGKACERRMCVAPTANNQNALLSFGRRCVRLKWGQGEMQRLSAPKDCESRCEWAWRLVLEPPVALVLQGVRSGVGTA